MVSYIYYIKYLRCYIIGKYCDIIDVGTAQCPGCIAPYLEADRNRKALITPVNVPAVDSELYDSNRVEAE